MPRLSIIILDRPEPTNQQVYRYVLWANAPAARQSFYATLAGPTFASAWKDALAADNTALQNGAVVEKVGTIQVPASATLAEIRSFLQARWTDYQASITTINPATSKNGSPAPWTSG